MPTALRKHACRPGWQRALWSRLCAPPACVPLPFVVCTLGRLCTVALTRCPRVQGLSPSRGSTSFPRQLSPGPAAEPFLSPPAGGAPGLATHEFVTACLTFPVIQHCRETLTQLPRRPLVFHHDDFKLQPHCTPHTPRRVPPFPPAPSRPPRAGERPPARSLRRVPLTPHTYRRLLAPAHPPTLARSRAASRERRYLLENDLGTPGLRHISRVPAPLK